VTNTKLDVLGWREWVGLPELGISAIKTKLDTGARTSALHATQIQSFEESGQLWVSFVVQADQVYSCKVRVMDQRSVKDSGGRSQLRYVIETSLKVGDQSFPIEVSLSDRTDMRFPLLLGRSALKGRFLVDSQSSFALGGHKDAPASQD
jgi:hypothetical protein